MRKSDVGTLLGIYNHYERSALETVHADRDINLKSFGEENLLFLSGCRQHLKYMLLSRDPLFQHAMTTSVVLCCLSLVSKSLQVVCCQLVSAYLLILRETQDPAGTSQTVKKGRGAGQVSAVQSSGCLVTCSEEFDGCIFGRVSSVRL